MSHQQYQQHPIVVEMVATLDQSQHEHYEERAAILEFSAGLDRSLAEAVALLEVVRRDGWGPGQK